MYEISSTKQVLWFPKNDWRVDLVKTRPYLALEIHQGKEIKKNGTREANPRDNHAKIPDPWPKPYETPEIPFFIQV